MSVRKDKETFAAYMREYNRNNKDRRRNTDFKRKFGISLDDYNQMFVEQKGLCLICACPETSIDHRTKETRWLAVDHNHETGEVRGLLCSRCNTAIGLLQDDVQLLANAISYLTQH